MEINNSNFSFWIKKHQQISKNDKNVEEFFKEQRNKFKDYIPNNVFSQPKTKSSKSGFNSVINNNIEIYPQKEIRSQKLNINNSAIVFAYLSFFFFLFEEFNSWIIIDKRFIKKNSELVNSNFSEAFMKNNKNNKTIYIE